jgi:hypothetical protein
MGSTLLGVRVGEVRKIAAVSLLVVLVLLVFSAPGFAWSRGGGGFHHGGFRGHGVVVIGPGCCWGGPYWGPYWGYYPPPYYSYAPAPVVVQEAPVYVERPAPPESYWYYCPSTRAYYPSVSTCNEAWLKVPPRPE